MNSPHVKELLFRYVDDDLPEDLRQQVEAHLASCKPCTDELAYVSRIQALIGRRSEAPPGLWQGVAARIQRDEAANLWRQFEWAGKRLVPIFAAAAVVLLAVIGSLNGPDPGETTGEAPNATPDATVESYLAAQWESDALEGLVLSDSQLSRNEVFILAASAAQDLPKAR